MNRRIESSHWLVGEVYYDTATTNYVKLDNFRKAKAGHYYCTFQRADDSYFSTRANEALKRFTLTKPLGSSDLKMRLSGTWPYKSETPKTKAATKSKTPQYENVIYVNFKTKQVISRG